MRRVVWLEGPRRVAALLGPLVSERSARHGGTGGCPAGPESQLPNSHSPGADWYALPGLGPRYLGAVCPRAPLNTLTYGSTPRATPSPPPTCSGEYSRQVRADTAVGSHRAAAVSGGESDTLGASAPKPTPAPASAATDPAARDRAPAALFFTPEPAGPTAGYLDAAAGPADAGGSPEPPDERDVPAAPPGGKGKP